MYYLDTSGLTKLYISETGTSWLHSLVGNATVSSLLTVELALVELTSAVVRRAKGGQIPSALAQATIAHIIGEWAWRFGALPLTPETLPLAVDLVHRHGLRGYDAIHLAVALLTDRDRQRDGLDPLVFISADDEQLRAAAAEGMQVDKPNLHP